MEVQIVDKVGLGKPDFKARPLKKHSAERMAHSGSFLARSALCAMRYA